MERKIRLVLKNRISRKREYEHGVEIKHVKKRDSKGV